MAREMENAQQAEQSADVGGGVAKGIVLKLAWADMMHEWVLSLCLVLAVSAVLGPLLLLFGIKFGTIETMRMRLMEDPVNRRITPITSRSLSRDWFKEIRARGDVAFVIPATRELSANAVYITVKGVTEKKKRSESDLAPTGPGDPLLLENGTPVPKRGQCVITTETAKKTGAKVGDVLTARVSRYIKNRFEKQSIELKLVGILGGRGGTVPMVYVPLKVVEAVEQFKDGQAVPMFGWKGFTPKAYPVYDGLMVITSKELDPVLKSRLGINTGFHNTEALDAAGLKAMAGYEMGPNSHAYAVTVFKQPAKRNSVTQVRNKLKGRKAVLIPYVKPIPARLLDGSGKELAAFNLAALPGKDPALKKAGVSPLGPWPAKVPSVKEALVVMLPKGVAKPAGEVKLMVKAIGQEMSFPVKVAEQASPSETVGFIPPLLAGVLRLGQTRNLSYDEDVGEFLTKSLGYASFRMYAKSIDDVPGLKAFFEADGLSVDTNEADIMQVKTLDYYLSLIFWLIAVVGIAGSASSLIASLYAAVERKKRDLSVLRLLGLARGALLRYPVYQGVVIASLGYLLSTGFFFIFAAAINGIFAADLRPGESYCRLPFDYLFIGWLGSAVIAALAAALAAWRVGRIEPAEALRDE